MNTTDRFPAPVGGLLDDQMWRTIDEKAMALPFCENCSKAIYPPSTCCPFCFKFELPWKKVSGRGKILSWTRFHRSYLPECPAPYNVIAVQLEVGAVLVSNLVGGEPADNCWIGRSVDMVYQDFSGKMLPRFQLS
ncbi:MAG TPA: OB-fold domain-containing protein [Burkholderiaceae bacterium]|nr:OB-fold domain-containing protein [Burkholderiaceae bacterium]